MPVADINSAATWASWYNPPFVRANRDRILGNDVDNLVAALATVGLQSGQRIALVGGSFGWVAEHLIQLGYGPAADGTNVGRVACIDTSTYIQANKAGNAVVEIMNVDVNAATGRRAVKVNFGSPNVVVDWAITEDILPVLTDSEAGVFAGACRALATNVAHWITPGYGPNGGQSPSQTAEMNWKSMANWKTLVTPDFVIRRGTSELL